MERTIERQRGLPGGRAVLGGLLMAVAAVGVYVAVEQAADEPTATVVVAADDLRVGEAIEVDDLDVVRVDLPGDQAATTFSDPDALAGHVVLGPIGDGEVVQASAVTDDAPTAGPLHELSLRLPRGQVAVGRLKAGERVDVFVTTEDRTESVARGVEVVQLTIDDESLTSDREIELVVAVPAGDAVAALVHALRTGEVTVVRSTFDAPSAGEPLAYDAGTRGDRAQGEEAEESSP